MSGVVRGLICAGLVASSGLARAQGVPAKPAAKSQPAKPAKAGSAAPASATDTPTAPTPSPGAPPSATPNKEDGTAKSSEASEPSEDRAPNAPSSGSATGPVSTPPARPTVRVFMRTENEPLVFSARAKNDDGTPTLCSSPCDERFLPGDYQLKLNGVAVEGPVKLLNPGTLHGQFISREGSRESGWLALNVGGILGGVFITVAALGGPSWAYIAGGGSLTAGGLIFVVTYRADSARVSFTPGEPEDMRGLPPPAPAQENSSGPSVRLDRPGLGAEARGLGFRIQF
jgi:hypothetical protein